MAQSPRRARKRAKPSFEVPSDVTSAAESGWVFRSDGASPPPAAPKPAASVSAAPKPAAPVAVAAKPAAPLPAPGPLRFAWLPLAIAYSTILAMLPQRDRGAK